jgi:succinate-semialdehyde dehydrogenase/glutarate-semialdehyde dehydrogenase
MAFGSSQRENGKMIQSRLSRAFSSSANPLNLKQSSLFRNQGYINGKWVNADMNQYLNVSNPSTSQVIGLIPDMGESEAKRVLMPVPMCDEFNSDALTHRQFKRPVTRFQVNLSGVCFVSLTYEKITFAAWAARPAKERANILRNWYNLMLEHKDDLAKILTTEQGKPIAEAQGEILYAASFLELFSEEATRVYGETIPAFNTTSRVVTVRQPIGVVGAITPWNFPSAMITRKAGPALAAGCTMVLKPSELTPFSASALCDLAERAGVPAGVFNMVTGDAKQIGAVLTGSPLVKKLSFTGSTAVGKLLYAQSAGTVKRLSLELGGNAPMVVFDDANLDLAVKGTLLAKYRNAGQTCVCANRIFVQAGIYDKFVDALSTAVAQMKVGDGFAPGVTMGPLINEAAADKVRTHIADAVARGATRVLGGEAVPGLNRKFITPAVVKDCSPDMLLSMQETFGPVAPVFKFTTDAEAATLCNATRAGLAAYFYTNHPSRVWTFAEKLQYGMVGINQGLVSHAYAPFGGVKESGLGREGSHLGIGEYLDVKTMHFAV